MATFRHNISKIEINSLVLRLIEHGFLMEKTNQENSKRVNFSFIV